MKKIILILLTLLSALSTQYSFGQWFKLNTGTGSSLCGIYFTDVNTGYAVGYGGTIIKTTDAGKSWQNYSISDGYQDFMSVYFTSPDTGFAVSDAGEIFKSTDSGINWFIVYENVQDPTLWFFSVCFTSDRVGYCVGADSKEAKILKTIDWGKNWFVIYASDSIGYLESVYFSDSMTGYTVGGGYGSYASTILKTTNSGVSWIPQNISPIINGLYGVYFINKDTGIAVGQNIILKTIDGGNSWHEKHNPVSEEWYGPAIYFADKNNVYTGGQEGNIIKSTDGGDNWFLQFNAKADVRGLYFTDKDTGYCVASGGTILKTTNGGDWVKEELGVKNYELGIEIYPNPINQSSVISYHLLETCFTTIIIFDLTGKEIAMLVNETKQKGTYKMKINFANLQNGIYYLKLNAGNTSVSDKMLIIR